MLRSSPFTQQASYTCCGPVRSLACAEYLSWWILPSFPFELIVRHVESLEHTLACTVVHRPSFLWVWSRLCVFRAASAKLRSRPTTSAGCTLGPGLVHNYLPDLSSSSPTIWSSSAFLFVAPLSVTFGILFRLSSRLHPRSSHFFPHNFSHFWTTTATPSWLLYTINNIRKRLYCIIIIWGVLSVLCPNSYSYYAASAFNVVHTIHRSRPFSVLHKDYRQRTALFFGMDRKKKIQSPWPYRSCTQEKVWKGGFPNFPWLKTIPFTGN